MMLVITRANGPCLVPLATFPVSCIGANTKEKKRKKTGLKLHHHHASRKNLREHCAALWPLPLHRMQTMNLGERLSPMSASSSIMWS